MANSINFIQTNAADELISKVLTGKTLNFTRMAVGDGFSYDTNVAKEFKTLVNEVLSLDITKKETLTASNIRITSAFKNTDAQKEFYYREVGLFAEDPDTGEEVLYAYGNRNDAAELITPTGSNVVTKQLAFVISVGDSANVTFNVNADVYALQEDMLDVQADITTLQTNLDELNRTKADKTQISSPYNYKGACTSTELASKTGMVVNDTWYLTDLKMKKTWNGTAWEQSSLNEADYQENLAQMSNNISLQMNTKIDKSYNYISIESFFNSCDDACFNVKNGTASSATNCHGRIINVSSGDEFKISCNAWNNEQVNFYSAFTTDDYSQVKYIGIGGTITDYNIVVPYGYTKMIINYISSSNYFVLTKKNYFVDVNKLLNRKFYGKKVNCLGDSITWGICDGNGTRGKSWVEYLVELNGFSEVRNYGISGSTISGGGDKGTRTYQPFWNRYTLMDDDADLVIVWGGINDFYLSNNVFDVNLISDDVDTFNGAFNVTLKGLIKKYPQARIIYITPMKCNTNMHFVNLDTLPLMETFTKNTRDYTLKDYVDKAKAICDYYSVPVLDLYTDGCFTPYLSEHKALYTNDGLHPTNAGYALIANRISQFINNIL